MCRVFDVEEGARASMQRARGEREPSVVRSVTSVAALPLKAPLAVGGLALNAFNNVAAMAGMGMPDLTPQEAGRQSLEATRQGDLAEAFVHFLEDAAEKEVGEGGGEDDEVGSGDPVCSRRRGWMLRDSALRALGFSLNPNTPPNFRQQIF